MQTSDPLRIMVVDDDEGFLEYVSSIIRSHAPFELAGQATSLAAARLALEDPRVDVLLVDLGLPDGSGVDLIREVSRAHSAIDIMVLTVFGDEGHVIASLEAGATGYILKRSLPADFVQTITELHEGGSPISPIIARQLLTRFRPPIAPSATLPKPVADALSEVTLSEREHQVLVYISKGFSMAEIAGLLKLSDHTIATYIKRIYRKLSVHSRTEALFEASRMGLL